VPIWCLGDFVILAMPPDLLIFFVCFAGAIALFSATFGQGDGPIFLDNVACIGNESKLAECQHLGIASHNCTHTKDAAVVCPGEIHT